MVDLSGPTYVEEIPLDMLILIVSTCDDLTVAEFVQYIFINTCMKSLYK